MKIDPRALEERYAYPPVTRPWIRTNFVSTLGGAVYADTMVYHVALPIENSSAMLTRSLAGLFNDRLLPGQFTLCGCYERTDVLVVTCSFL